MKNPTDARKTKRETWDIGNRKRKGKRKGLHPSHGFTKAEKEENKRRFDAIVNGNLGSGRSVWPNMG